MCLDIMEKRIFNIETRIDDENDAYLQEDKTPLFNDWRGRLHTGVSSSYFIDFISLKRL